MMTPDLAVRTGTLARSREFRFTRADFDAIAIVVREIAGIKLPSSKAPLVYARLAKRLRALGLQAFSDYVALLGRPTGLAERDNMLSALTTNVTQFFRERHHFDHFRTHILPGLLRDKVGRRVRLWSAACSTGQEAYSLAAILAEATDGAPPRDLKILATDIDDAVLEQAETGRYEAIDGVPPDLRRWFRRDEGGWRADPRLRGMVAFRPLNLAQPWPLRGKFDALFCRNVAIYFDHAIQARLWSACADVIHPGGTLYIGHSERIEGPAAAQFENVGITTYRRREPAA